MPTSLLDSVVFRDIFGTEPMRRVWSDGNRTLRYLHIEAALARAQASVGVIPVYMSYTGHISPVRPLFFSEPIRRNCL
jgi:adenylosuccinate lyase